MQILNQLVSRLCLYRVLFRSFRKESSLEKHFDYTMNGIIIIELKADLHTRPPPPSMVMAWRKDVDECNFRIKKHLI